MEQIRVGTASWTDKTLIDSGWYPPEATTAEKRLRYYARQFPLVEVDSTYYALPAEQTAAMWAERTPASFTFNVKAFSLFTQHPTPVKALPADLREAAGKTGKDRVYLKDVDPEVTGMIAARNALRGLAATGAGPGELLRHLNYAACHLTEGIAGTVVCGRYHPDTRVLRWARAGHLPPILVRDGAAEMLPLPGGVLLGLDPDATYEEAELQMRCGDTLLLFTDGLIERRADSISDALRELTAAAVPAGPDAASHADRILSSAVSDTGDDACLVAVRIL